MERFMSTIRLIKVEIIGMKGLEKKVSFQFLNDTINYNIYSKTTSTKAIFGANGSGKSSFITAMDVYKKICESASYLVSDSTSQKLSKLINKKSLMFSINVCFADCDEKVTYCHSISIDNKSSKPYIKSESISRIIGKTINEEKKEILRIEKGNIILFSEIPSLSKEEKTIDKYLYSLIGKINQYTTSTSIFSDINFLKDIDNILTEKKREKWHKDSVFGALFHLCSFISQLSIYMTNEDTHRIIDEKTYLLIKKFFNMKMVDNPILWDGNIVEKSRIKSYESKIEKMARFIKLFKPELKSIEVDKREYENFYKCSFIMKYDEYNIESEYESTGIKNLMEIFISLENASSGGISFIDEMDANMNEVYLTKICEYFTTYSKGQLCFTTHNTAPMKILKKQTRGIDFINGNTESIEWKKNGNSSPSKLYFDGMIPGIPFNVEDFDFINVFSS